jgi:hypothetical protein
MQWVYSIPTKPTQEAAARQYTHLPLLGPLVVQLVHLHRHLPQLHQVQGLPHLAETAAAQQALRQVPEGRYSRCQQCSLDNQEARIMHQAPEEFSAWTTMQVQKQTTSEGKLFGSNTSRKTRILI